MIFLAQLGNDGARIRRDDHEDVRIAFLVPIDLGTDLCGDLAEPLDDRLGIGRRQPQHHRAYRIVEARELILGGSDDPLDEAPCLLPGPLLAAFDKDAAILAAFGHLLSLRDAAGNRGENEGETDGQLAHAFPQHQTKSVAGPRDANSGRSRAVEFRVGRPPDGDAGVSRRHAPVHWPLRWRAPSAGPRRNWPKGP